MVPMSKRAALLAALLACSAAGDRPLHAQDKVQLSERPSGPSLEEIFVLRSVRETRKPPTEFCSKENSGVGKSLVEENFSLRSMASEAVDGRVVDADVRTIGTLHSCLGQTSNPAITEFYIDVRIGAVAFKGLGQCQVVAADFPERGVTPVACTVRLAGLPDGYVGGLLISNTMFSAARPLGTETEPGGYAQSSIAAIRLWKKRGA